MEKTIYYSPKVKEINLSIKRSVCINVSDPEGITNYSKGTLDGGDDFTDDELFNNW